MKTLFVSLTDYQLINYINIKKHIIPDKKADIIIVNNKVGNAALADRLKELQIFDNVYLYTESLPGLHRYFRSISDNSDRISFTQSIANDLKNLIHNIKGKCSDKIYTINCRLRHGESIDFLQYDHVVGIDTKAIVKDCREIVLELTKGKCTISSVDEGVDSYLNEFMVDKSHVNNVYLYEPKMALYYERFPEKIIQIPKINKNDKEFIELLNKTFAFDPNDIVDLNNKVIFFDQNWDPMPKYLRKMNWWKKIIFHNPYKKHLKESVFYDIKMEIFKAVSEVVGDRLLVKLHPRSDVSFIEDYKKHKCEILPKTTAPWELFACNCLIKNNKWVTLTSSAVCSYYFTIESDKWDNNFMIVCGRLPGVSMDQEMKAFFERVASLLPQLVYVPKSINELQNKII